MPLTTPEIKQSFHGQKKKIERKVTLSMNHQQIESVLPSFTGLKIIDSRILLTAQLRLKSGILNLHIVNLICSPWSPSQN